MKHTFAKRLIPVILAVLMVLSLFPASALAATDGFSLTIIHVNDRHGRMGADAYVAALAAQAKGNVLILDAGDSLHGQSAANITKGESMVGLMNAVGYDAMTTGNHDYNFGLERLAEMAGLMDFPLLAANVKDANGDNLFESYIVFDMQGVKVGVFGIATPETATSTDPRIVGELTFEDPIATAEAMVYALRREGCAVIIALAHLGVDGATLTANRSDTLATVDGIDIVIDGHSHTAMPEGIMVGDTLVAQTGSFAENVGVVEFSLNGAQRTISAKLYAIPAEDAEEQPFVQPSDAILAKIAELEKGIDPIANVIIGHSSVKLEGAREYVRKEETNLANVITDSMLHATGADVALMNGGGIRESIPAGDITMGQALTVLPFSNIITTVELTGNDLLAALEHGVSAYPELVGRNIQVAGLSFTFNAQGEPGKRVTSVTVADGSALLPGKVYTVATIDFLASGGDGYTTLANGLNRVFYGSDGEALAEYLKVAPNYGAQPEGRITVATSGAPVVLGAEVVGSDAGVSQTGTYTVKSGDTLTKIAKEQGVVVYEIMLLNGIGDKNAKLKAGQILIISGGVKKAA